MLSGVVAFVVAVVLICAIGQGNLRKDVSAQTEPESGKELVPESVSYMSDSLLIGDSRAETLGIYGGADTMDVYAERNLNISTVMSSKVAKDSSGEACTVLEALTDKSYDRIYVSFGLEELNWYKEVYIKAYRSFLDRLVKVQPDADIYVLSVLPVSAGLSAESCVYNNPDIDTINSLMQEMCDGYDTVSFLDITDSIAKDGVLPEDAGTDGIHFGKEYCEKVMEYIMSSTGQAGE